MNISEYHNPELDPHNLVKYRGGKKDWGGKRRGEMTTI